MNFYDFMDFMDFMNFSIRVSKGVDTNTYRKNHKNHKNHKNITILSNLGVCV